MVRCLIRSLAASLVFVAPLALVAQAPPDVVGKVAEESAENKSKVMEHLDQLTNQIGPRLTGSERLNKACEWARDKFKSFGIDNARLEQWGAVEVGFDRGHHQGFLKEGDVTKPLTFGTNAWTPGTGGLKEGPAILGPADEAGLAALREKARGAWLVRSSRSPREISTKLNELCAEAGAYGVVGNGGDLIITSGNHMTKWDNLPKLVRINVFKGDYEDLVKRLEDGKDVRLGFDVQNHFKEGPVPVYNVIADIPGTEKPNEMVIVGGHIDSWDGATGTTDNGTGVATTLEAARLLMAAGAKPKRTIRFMLWSGEEQGLLGSIAWIKKHPDELPKISAVLVHDGGTNYVSGIQSTAAMLPQIKTAFKPVIEVLGQTMEDSLDSRPSGGREGPRAAPDKDETLRFSIRQVGGLPRGVGSDHDAFLTRGVPGFFWRQSGRANYTHTHHTQHDKYEAAIPEYQRHSSKVIALGALGVANLDELLSRENLAAAGPGGRRRLGVQFGDEGADLTILEVSEGGRAEKAGLKAGDKIVKIDDLPVKDRSQMSDALNMGGFKKTVTVVRDKAEKTVTIEFPAPDSRPQ
jgi:carboxypeptidase Q